MTGAAQAVQAALVSALEGHAPLAAEIGGVFDGPPARAVFPYVAIGAGASGDWSHKTGRGREHRLALTIWDDGDSPSRLHRLMAEAEHAIEAIDRDIGGHRIASLLFLRSRVVRDADGPWAGIIEYRARTLED
ncbi:MAG: hypothetical protein JWM75_3064 [Sphingomonas bacterium]|nr:hypothetical protein [Sphingomonas bacterium]